MISLILVLDIIFIIIWSCLLIEMVYITLIWLTNFWSDMTLVYYDKLGPGPYKLSLLKWNDMTHYGTLGLGSYK